MNVSHPSVHPVEAPPPATEAENVVRRVRMEDIQGMPGTIGGLVLRACQFLFAVVALCVMATTNDFPSVSAFWYSLRPYLFLLIYGNLLFCFLLSRFCALILQIAASDSNIRFDLQGLVG